MQEKQRHNSAGFGNGFLLGMIVGGAIVFLLCTKMGRRILKEMSENGLSALSSIDKIADPEKIQNIIDQEEKDILSADAVVDAPPVHASNGHYRSKEASKRFFRGTKRRV